MMETKLKNVNCKISNILLAQHFLQRAKLNPITIQNILAKVETESEEKVLKQVKQTFEILVNSFDNLSQMNTTFYGNQHQNRFRYRSKSEPRRGDYRSERGRGDYRSERGGRRDRTRSRSIGFRERGKSRSKSRGREFYKNREAGGDGNKGEHHTAYTCDKFNLPDSDFSKCPGELNIFRSETENKAIVDSGCPKTVSGKLWYSVYKDSLKEFKGIDNIKTNDSVPV